MNTILSTTGFLRQETETTVAFLLLSASCVGNDGKSCPLFHGSLAAKLVSWLDSKIVKPADFISIIPTEKLQLFLLGSNCIGWSPSVYLPDDVDLCRKVMNKLSRTNYSPRVLKSVHLRSENAGFCSEFLLEHCQQLEVLDFYGHGVIESLDFLLSKKTLNTLVFGSSYQMAPAALKHLSQIKWLKKLVIKTADDEALKAVAQITALEHLDLNMNPEFTDEGLAELGALENLRYLDVGWTSISGEGLSKIYEGCSFLETLKMEMCFGMDDTALAGIENLKYITHLDIRRNCLSQECEKQILAVPSLQVLKMDLLGDEDVKYFEVEQLEWLLKLPNLQHLEIGVNGQWGIPEAEFLAFKSRFPCLKTFQLWQ